MKCPDDIAPTIIELISTAVIRVRAAGWSGDAELCAIEADHVHNLPGLLLNFSFELLGFYWRVERESFRRAATDLAARTGTAADFRVFEKTWTSLEQRLNQELRMVDSQIGATHRERRAGGEARIGESRIGSYKGAPIQFACSGSRPLVASPGITFPPISLPKSAPNIKSFAYNSGDCELTLWKSLRTW